VFHVVAKDAEILHRELSERNLDFLVASRFGPFPDQHVQFEILFDESLVVVAGAQNPWVRRRRIELADLVNESWALPPPESVIGAIFVEAFRACGLDYPRVTVVTSSREMRIPFHAPPGIPAGLVAAGRFLAIFPTSVLRFPAKHPELKVLPVELPMARVPNGIATLKNRTLSPPARLFIEHARDVAKPLAKR
jgi:DNA-binding transcriptional LysR family regulator